LVQVQNCVALAMSQLPPQVQQQGVNVKKKSPNILLAVNLTSSTGRYDDLYLSNYATIQLKDKLARLPGVGDIVFLGERDYSIRVWFDPDQLATRNMMASDVVQALRGQNVQVPAGQLGQEPAVFGQESQQSFDLLGRLTTPEEFGEIVIKTGP